MTFERRSPCSSSEVLGAFAEGRLGPEEREAVIAHLDTCDRCRDELAALADLIDSGAASTRRLPVWWAAAAAVVIVAAAAAIFWRGLGHRDARPVAPLIAASSALDHRVIEPRLDGFGWAEYRGSVRATADERSPEHLKLLGAAGEILQEANRNPAPDAEHAAGVASLFIAEPGAAVSRLNTAIAKRPEDPSAWSDLAAARYVLAARLSRPTEYPAALAAADRALKLDPHFPAALFNRALILERIGLIEDARAAWKRYLEADGSSDWARESRERLEKLPPAANSSAEFRSAIDRAEPAQLVARFPQQARAFAEVELLGRWAESFRANDGAADARLARARDIGAALQRRSGESLLAGAVQAIDDASGAERARIAEAHVLYRTGRLALSRHETEAARPALLRAVSLFGNGPGALNARYYAAVAQYDSGRAAAAGEELDALARDLGDRPFKALRAQTAWQRGLVHGSQGRWPAALEQYGEAGALFEQLGETSNAAFVDALIAEAAILLGRHDDAWGGWTRALRALSQHGLNDRLLVTLGFISRTESMAGRDAEAASILDLEIAHANDDDALRAEALLRRAIVSARMRDFAAARRGVDEGVRAANGIADAAARRSALGSLKLAEGMALADDPQRALPLLTAAIEHDRAVKPLRLPAVWYERGRVLRALGRIDEATDDLFAAVHAIEAQRAEEEWRDVRAVAGGVDGVYAALAELLLERGRTREAFAVADRAAAHAFYGAAAARSAVTVEELQRGLGRDAVVEYLTLPRELVIFAVTSRTVHVQRVAAGDLRARVAALSETIRKRGDVRGASLYPTLIAPIRELLADAETITFVPDAALESVPFSALFDAGTGRWLIEQHTIRLAPAALGVSLETHARDPRIVVIQPPTIDLPSAAAEAAAIAQRYRHATVVDGRSPAAVLAAMETADIIHYAGHTSSAGETGLSLGQTTLYGADIARLRLRRAPLVVLAGCRTLRGAGNSEDVATSLARAFLLAGARAVVGTAWDLNDRAAAALFERMHAANAAAGDAVAALRDAQRSALSNAASQPADWAAAEIIVRSVLTGRKTP